MFLTPDDLKQLTGLKRPSAQVRWLTAHHFKFTVNALGRPSVMIAEVARKHLGGPAIRQQEPNWEGMRHGTAS